MTLYQDVEIIRYGGGRIKVYYRDEYVGEIRRVPSGTSRRIYTDGANQYDNLGIAARELVRRVRNV